MRPQPTRRESGFTLIEMVVATAIFMTVLTLVLPTLDVITKSSNTTDSITAADTTMRAPLAQLTTEISSAGDVTVLGSSNTSSRLPAFRTTATGTTQGFGIVLYDENGASLTNGGSNSTGGTCYVWQVYNGHLQVTHWVAGATEPTYFTPAAWKITIDNTTGNTVNGVTTAWQPPFSYDGTNVYLNFYANGGDSSASSQLATAIAAQGGADGGSSICGTSW